MLARSLGTRNLDLDLYFPLLAAIVPQLHYSFPCAYTLILFGKHTPSVPFLLATPTLPGPRTRILVHILLITDRQ